MAQRKCGLVVTMLARLTSMNQVHCKSGKNLSRRGGNILHQSKQAQRKKGSIIIRDLRLWHAGMPNRTDEPRVMLAFVVQPAWWQGKSKVKLPLDVKNLVDSWEFQFDAEWFDDVDHMKLSSADVDFGSKSEVLRKYRESLAHRPDYYTKSY